MMYIHLVFLFFFFFNDTATTEIYTLSLHDALPISVAAETMRRILIDRARRRRTREQAGFAEPDTDWESQLASAAPTDELLAVHEAVEGLAVQEPLAAELVKLRYFVGLTMEEAAEALGLALRKTERLWAFARAWLRVELGGETKARNT